MINEENDNQWRSQDFVLDGALTFSSVMAEASALARGRAGGGSRRGRPSRQGSGYNPGKFLKSEMHAGEF
jgi:uncharacterized membrane protein